MNTLELQILYLAILLIVSLSSGFLTLKYFPSNGTAEKLISLLNCFSGGVILGLSLLELLPEVRNNFQLANAGGNYPLAEICTISGILFVLLVEHLTTILSKYQKTRTNKSVTRSEDIPLLPSSELRDLEREVRGVLKAENYMSEDREVTLGVKQDNISAIRSLVFFLGLSLHCLFEGIAIGLAPNASSANQIGTAVIIHKGITMFSFSSSIAQNWSRFGAKITAIVIVSLMSSAGGFVGIGLGTIVEGRASFLLNGVLQGITIGTFMFIAFFELLANELGDKTAENFFASMRLFSLFVGVSLITILQLLLKE